MPKEGTRSYGKTRKELKAEGITSDPPNNNVKTPTSEKNKEAIEIMREGDLVVLYNVKVQYKTPDMRRPKQKKYEKHLPSGNLYEKADDVEMYDRHGVIKGIGYREISQVDYDQIVNELGVERGEKKGVNGTPFENRVPLLTWWEEEEKHKIAQLSMSDQESDDNPEDDDDDDELEVQEITFKGNTYYLDESSGDVWHPETSEKIGKLTDGQQIVFKRGFEPEGEPPTLNVHKVWIGVDGGKRELYETDDGILYDPETSEKLGKMEEEKRWKDEDTIYSDSEEEDSDDELEVVDITHNDENFFHDEKTNKIYDPDTGAVVGNFVPYGDDEEWEDSIGGRVVMKVDEDFNDFNEETGKWESSDGGIVVMNDDSDEEEEDSEDDLTESQINPPSPTPTVPTTVIMLEEELEDIRVFAEEQAREQLEHQKEIDEYNAMKERANANAWANYARKENNRAEGRDEDDDGSDEEEEFTIGANDDGIGTVEDTDWSVWTASEAQEFLDNIEEYEEGLKDVPAFKEKLKEIILKELMDKEVEALKNKMALDLLTLKLLEDKTPSISKKKPDMARIKLTPHPKYNETHTKIKAEMDARKVEALKEGGGGSA